ARALHVVEYLGALEQRLRRDAAPVETDPTELGALDACGRQAEPCAPDRGDVPSRTRTDHDDVVVAHSASDSGCSIRSTNGASHFAPSAPSITRWSHDIVTVIRLPGAI